MTDEEIKGMIKHLRAAAIYYKGTRDAIRDTRAADMIEQLAARVAEAEEDAARYRWLRDCMTWTNQPPSHGEIFAPQSRLWFYETYDLTNNTLDSLIDAARSEG